MEPLICLNDTNQFDKNLSIAYRKFQCCGRHIIHAQDYCLRMFSWKLFSLKSVISPYLSLAEKNLKYSFTQFLQLYFRCSSASQNNLSCQCFMQVQNNFKGQNSNQLIFSFVRFSQLRITFKNQNTNWYSCQSAETSNKGKQRHIIHKFILVLLSYLLQASEQMNAVNFSTCTNAFVC